MIKAIAIDIGGVYIRETRDDIFAYLSKKFNTDFKKHIEGIYMELNNGKIEPKEFFERIADKLKINESILKRVWFDAFKFNVNEDIEKIIKKLKKSGYKIVTVTNTNKLNFSFHKKSGHYKYFDVVIASCKVGFQKPDERIYFVLMKKLNLKAEEILLVDNFGDNFSAAEKLGMKTIVYKNPEKLKEDLSAFGIKV